MTELRAYGGVDGEQRRADRRARLVEAGVELLGTGAELSVRAACRTAGVASRYFYESFADREALAAAVHDRVVTTVAGAAARAVDSATGPRPVRVRAGVAAIVAAVADDRRVGHILFSPEQAARRRSTTLLFIGLFTERQAEPNRLVAAFAVGGFAQALSSWLAGDAPATQDEVIDRCTALLVAVV